MKRAYATVLCGGDGYLPGVEALGSSLKRSGTQAPMVVMVTDDVSDAAREALAEQGWTIRDIAALQRSSPSVKPLFPRFDRVFAKLRAWQLTDFDKVVLLDADTIVLQNVDDLFERPQISAAPDFLMPDRFNSGVLVLDPSEDTFQRMVAALNDTETYDGGDQGFLNTFFAGWYGMPAAHRLPAGYNILHFIFQFMHAHPGLRLSIAHEVKIIHYAVQKPWQSMPQVTGGSARWWRLYYEAHPEEATPLRNTLHALEDWTYERVLDVFIR